MLTTNQTKHIQKIIHKDFGMDISEKEAFEIGESLINLFNILTQNEYEETNKND